MNDKRQSNLNKYYNSGASKITPEQEIIDKISHIESLLVKYFFTDKYDISKSISNMRHFINIGNFSKKSIRSMKSKLEVIEEQVLTKIK